MDPGRSSDSPPATEVEDRLRTLPEVELLGVLHRASNYTFLARLGPDPELLAVYKPAAGESPLWDFESGTLYRREVAAYLLARALRWPDIPPTVIRESAPHGVGAMQLYVEADPGRHYLRAAGVPESAWEAVAVFDVITNNADRKAGHCLCDRDGRVWVIDHGLTFHVDHKLRTVIWDFAGRPLPERLRPSLEKVAGDIRSGPLGAAMSELISARELRALLRRIDGVLAAGWVFPSPDSAWSVPWPLV